MTVSPTFLKLFFNILFFYLLLVTGNDLMQVKKWTHEAGGDIDVNFIHKNPKAPITATDASNPYWIAFKSAVDEL